LNELENRPKEHITDSEILRVYRLRFENLNWTASDGNRQRRWAVLEPVGSFAGSLFGLTTVQETEELRQKVNTMIDVMGQQSHSVHGLTVAIHDLTANQQAVKQQVDKLTDSVNNIIGLMAQTEELSETVWESQCYIAIESVLSLLESYRQREDLFERDFQLTRNLAEIGHVTEDLISPQQLESTLLRINSPLSAEYVYRNFPIHFMTLTTDRIGYIFTVPKLAPEVYYAWEVVTVPYPTQSAHIRIKPELNNLAVAHVSGTVIDTSNCLYDSPKLCPSAINYKNLPCVQGILAHNVDLLKLCHVNAVNITIPAIKKIATDELFLSSPHDTITERCKGQPPSTEKLQGLAMLLKLQPNCTLVSNQFGWSFELGSRSAELWNVEKRFLLPGLDVNFSAPIDLSVLQMNWTKLQKLSDLTYHKLPEFNDILNIPHLAPHNAYTIWVLVGAIILIIGVVLVVILVLSSIVLL
jgi:hypothetical protein